VLCKPLRSHSHIFLPWPMLTKQGLVVSLPITLANAIDAGAALNATGVLAAQPRERMPS
jgi:hypothetical protein